MLSELIVTKPVLPVALSVIWIPNWLSAVQMNCTSHGLMYFSGDTECYSGIKPVADGHPKPRIGSDDVTPSITSPLV